MLKNLRGVLFDFDGVLGDTMEDNYRAWIYALGLHGASFTKEEYFLLEGEKVARIASIVLERCGKDPSLGSNVAKAKDKYYLENNSFKFSPGISELIPFLKKSGIKTGCVSGGARMRLINPATAPILDQLDCIVTADDVTHGKPDPEPYLTGAKKFDLDPSQIIVVENAPLGIRSAKAANMYCIAVCSTLTPKYLGEADTILPSTASLKEFLTSNDIRPSQKL